MNLPNELPLEHAVLADRNVAIKLVGIGGAGTNAVDRLKMEGLERLQLAVVNTDHQALSSSPVQDKVLIGMSTTRGLGAGGDPELGREAAESDREKLAKLLVDCDLVFLIAGMGGGTGGGATPVIAEMAAEAGALVIAFVTLPFSFEGGRRLKQAEEGLSALRRVCDAVIPLPNDILLQEAADSETVLDSFSRADEWMGRGVKSIWSMLSRTGLINVDFATLRQAFQQRGAKTLFGLAEGSGPEAAAEAIAALKLCPLLHTPEFSRRADRLLVNISGGTDLTLPRVNEIMTAIAEQFGRESHIIMGAVIDEGMQGRVEITVLGASDMGTRGALSRRSLPPRARILPARPDEPAPKPEPSVVAAAEPAPPPSTQEEFGFGELESRGQFERTDRNLFDGQDLDVPTYLRKGIKIAI